MFTETMDQLYDSFRFTCRNIHPSLNFVTLIEKPSPSRTFSYIFKRLPTTISAARSLLILIVSSAFYFDC